MKRFGEYVVICSVLGLTMWMSPLVWGAEPGQPVPGSEEEDIKTREVIVSATKTPLPAKQVTSAVEVMTGEELQERKIKTVRSEERRVGKEDRARWGAER